MIKGCPPIKSSDAVSFIRSNLHGGPDLEHVVVVAVIIFRLNKASLASLLTILKKGMSLPYITTFSYLIKLSWTTKD